MKCRNGNFECRNEVVAGHALCRPCLDGYRHPITSRLYDWIETMIADPETRPRVAKALRRFLDSKSRR